MCRFTNSTNDPICKMYNPEQYNLPDTDPIFYGNITLQNFCTKNIVIEKDKKLERECKKYSSLLTKDSFHSGCHYASLKDPQRVTGSWWSACSGWNFPEPGGLWGTCKVEEYYSNKFECCTGIDQSNYTATGCFLDDQRICHPKYTIPTEKPCQNVFMNEIPTLIKNSSDKKTTFDTVVVPIISRQIYGPKGIPGKQPLMNLNFAQNLMSQIFYQLSENDKSIIYDVCSKTPALCQTFLRDYCAYEDYHTLLNTPEKTKFCGCYMDENVYSSYAQFGINRECTPSCNMSGVIPYIDSSLNPSTCKDTICMIDDISIALNQSVVGNSGLNISQVCGNCVNTTSCECRISNTNITAIASDLGEIKIANFCSGNAVCTDSEHNTVPCEPTNQDASRSSAKKEVEEKLSIFNNFNILFPIIVVSVVIIIFVIVFVVCVALF